MSKNRAEQGGYHPCTSCKRRTGVAEVRFTTEAQRHGEERLNAVAAEDAQWMQGIFARASAQSFQYRQ
jgi:hypothetical protein